MADTKKTDICTAAMEYRVIKPDPYTGDKDQEQYMSLFHFEGCTKLRQWTEKEILTQQQVLKAKEDYFIGAFILQTKALMRVSFRLMSRGVEVPGNRYDGFSRKAIFTEILLQPFVITSIYWQERHTAILCLKPKKYWHYNNFIRRSQWKCVVE